MSVAIAALLAVGLAAPAIAQGSPAGFDEAAWRAEWNAADTDGDGRLGRDEATAANANISDEVFDRIDTNGDGFISPDEDKVALFKAKSGE